MSYIANRDYNLEVLLGNVPGHAMGSIRGHDSVLDTTRVTLAPTTTTVDINQSTIHATPATVDVASTSTNDDAGGSGLLTVLLIGLDSSGDAQTETITMDGTTAVTSSNTYSAINGLRSISWGATTWNEGDIWVGTGTFTAGVPAVHMFAMGIRQNVGLTAYYTVPNAKRLVIRQLLFAVGTTNKDVEFFIEQSANGTNWFTEIELPFEPGELTSDVIGIAALPAGQHIRLEAISSASGTQATGVLGFELVDD